MPIILKSSVPLTNQRKILSTLILINTVNSANTTRSPLENVTITTPRPSTAESASPTVSPTTEEEPESPEVEQHSSMTIFFILLVVGKL